MYPEMLLLGIDARRPKTLNHSSRAAPTQPQRRNLRMCGNVTVTGCIPRKFQVSEEQEMIEQIYLKDTLLQFRKLKTQADRAVAQVGKDQFFMKLDPESNSIAIIMKHLAGNMRSRWTDFLTSDGEKPARDRDGEFETADTVDTQDNIMRVWEEGWSLVFEAMSSLGTGDLEKVITIRGEPHGVVEAINRQMTHYAAHVGQIVLLAKHYAGAKWQTLSIPRGKSREFDVSKNGGRVTL